MKIVGLSLLVVSLGMSSCREAQLTAPEAAAVGSVGFRSIAPQASASPLPDVQSVRVDYVGHNVRVLMVGHSEEPQNRPWIGQQSGGYSFGFSVWPKDSGVIATLNAYSVDDGHVELSFTPFAPEEALTRAAFPALLVPLHGNATSWNFMFPDSMLQAYYGAQHFDWRLDLSSASDSPPGYVLEEFTGSIGLMR
jgi:hypothetical protein